MRRALVRHPALQLLILVVVALALVLVYQNAIAPAVGEEPTVGARAAGALGSVAVLVLVFLLARYVVERRPFVELGLPRRHVLRDLLGGLLLGMALIGTVVLVMALLGWYRVDEVSFRAGDLAGLVALMLLVAAFEEALARGLLQRLAERWLGTWAAVLLASVVFALLHSGDMATDPLSTLVIGTVASLLFGGAFVLTRSLWFPIGIHAAWNFTQGWILPPSNTDLEFTPLVTPIVDGPAWGDGESLGIAERGVVGLTVLTVAAIVMLVLVVRKRRIYHPPWLARLTGTRATPATRLLPEPDQDPADPDPEAEQAGPATR